MPFLKVNTSKETSNDEEINQLSAEIAVLKNELNKKTEMLKLKQVIFFKTYEKSVLLKIINFMLFSIKKSCVNNFNKNVFILFIQNYNDKLLTQN